MCSSILPQSEREFPIRGLNLIRLLIQNRIADFHTTLESLPLPADELIANPFIRHPVNLERWLMEGSYSKVWNAREEAPAEEYKFFVDSLMGTIRSVYFSFIVTPSPLRDRTAGDLLDAIGTRSRAVKKQRTRVCRSRTQQRYFSSGHNQKYWTLPSRYAQNLVMHVYVLTLSCHLSAGLADRLVTRSDYIRSERRGENGDTKGEADRQQSRVCTRVRADRIDWSFSLRFIIKCFVNQGGRSDLRST